jgi:hypothetical protein
MAPPGRPGRATPNACWMFTLSRLQSLHNRLHRCGARAAARALRELDEACALQSPELKISLEATRAMALRCRGIPRCAERSARRATPALPAAVHPDP